MSSEDRGSLTYQKAGVDIEAGDRLVEAIKPLARRTLRSEVVSGIGGFAGLFAVPSRYQEPILVAGTDGVGTKLKLAIQMKKHDTIGLDLVAMCVNDLLVQGAEPLFFLDYYATARLEVEVAATVIKGISEGCMLSNMALLGGETAEMPGLYQPGDYDLAGFCVGVVEKSRIIDGSRVRAGDSLIGMASSGPHSNGYSLIRRILSDKNFSLAESLKTDPSGKTLGELLLEPTKIYTTSLLPLFSQFELHALAHITGGGIIGNLPRVVPDGLEAVIETSSWEWPPIFRWLQAQGRITEEEMYRTFNCGVGMILCVSPEAENSVIELLGEYGETAWKIGHIAAGSRKIHLH